MPFIERIWQHIRLRIEQEEVIFRYAMHCHSGRLSQFLLIIRPIVLVLVISLAASIIFGFLNTASYSHTLFYGLSLFIYLVLLVNLIWQKGSASKRISVWQKGLVGLLILQGSLLLAFTVTPFEPHETPDTFVQVDHETITTQLPGGVVQEEVVGLAILDVEVDQSIDVDVSSDFEDVEELSDEESTITDENTPVYVVGQTLNYPNPCRLGREGTTIGYFLSTAADIEIRVYDPFAREIYREQFAANSPGGLGTNPNNPLPEQYNRVSVTPNKLGTHNVPAGIYFYLILHEGNALARGRIAAIP